MEEKLEIKIAGKLESFLHIPSFLCEYLQNELQQEHYEEVIEYIIERKEERDIEMQDKVLKKLKEKDKEIERLNKELKSLQDSYDIEEEQANYHIDLTDDLREEVDRLNNIINEFDKWLENEIKFQEIVENAHFLRKARIKLQELKGSDKE